MRVVIQRVLSARVTVNNSFSRKIANGILIFVGVEDSDSDEDINWLSGKIIRLRIFNDEAGVMNKSIIDIQGAILVVSQFTLYASTKKGNRPSYTRSAKPEVALNLYNKFIKKLENNYGKSIVTGEFGADMKIELVNHGPVTIIIDSKNKE